jgi:hypothetical protein
VLALGIKILFFLAHFSYGFCSFRKLFSWGICPWF